VIKMIVILIVFALVVTYFVDPSALKPWSNAAGDVGQATAKVVKSAGEETSKAIHKATRPDDTVVDKTKNAVEDKVQELKDAVK